MHPIWHPYGRYSLYRLQGSFFCSSASKTSEQSKSWYCKCFIDHFQLKIDQSLLKYLKSMLQRFTKQKTITKIMWRMIFGLEIHEHDATSFKIPFGLHPAPWLCLWAWLCRAVLGSEGRIHHELYWKPPWNIAIVSENQWLEDEISSWGRAFSGYLS